jgi:hypothetical protein
MRLQRESGGMDSPNPVRGSSLFTSRIADPVTRSPVVRTSRSGGSLSRRIVRAFLLLAPLVLFVGGQPVVGQTRTPREGPRTAPKRDITPLRRQYDERRSKFQQNLADLAERCETDDLAEAADAVRMAARRFDPETLRVRDLPREIQDSSINDLSETEKGWRVPLRKERRDYAQDLFALSQKVLGSGHLAFAFDLIREVAHHDPDHAAARKALGFVRSGDEWMSPFEARMAREKKVWSDQFGWIPSEHLERMTRGERFYKGRWISAEREAEIRRDFAQAWEIRSEHYLVRTNYSLDKGVDLAAKLEGFHSLFFQNLAGFFKTPEEFRQLLSGSGGPKIPTKPLVVHFYRSRDEYIARLKRETSQHVEVTRGIYFPKTGIAHFFHDPESQDDSTLYHEATHQLLSGARPGHGEIGVKSDFWPIEGIACYMESFHQDGTDFSFGDPQTLRFQAARAHFVVEKYYVPLPEFCRMGMQAYQESREIKRNYAQGAGLVHFFLHYGEGLYRDEFIEYLSQIYSTRKATRDNPERPWEIADVEPELLDRQYADHIRQLKSPDGQPNDAAASP